MGLARRIWGAKQLQLRWERRWRKPWAEHRNVTTLSFRGLDQRIRIDDVRTWRIRFRTGKRRAWVRVRIPRRELRVGQSAGVKRSGGPGTSAEPTRSPPKSAADESCLRRGGRRASRTSKRR